MQQMSAEQQLTLTRVDGAGGKGGGGGRAKRGANGLSEGRKRPGTRGQWAREEVDMSSSQPVSVSLLLT